MGARVWARVSAALQSRPWGVTRDYRDRQEYKSQCPQWSSPGQKKEQGTQLGTGLSAWLHEWFKAAAALRRGKLLRHRERSTVSVCIWQSATKVSWPLHSCSKSSEHKPQLCKPTNPWEPPEQKKKSSAWFAVPMENKCIAHSFPGHCSMYIFIRILGFIGIQSKLFSVTLNCYLNAVFWGICYNN